MVGSFCEDGAVFPNPPSGLVSKTGQELSLPFKGGLGWGFAASSVLDASPVS